MDLDGAGSGLCFTEEGQTVFGNLDTGQIQSFAISGGSQETVDSLSWGEGRPFEDMGEGFGPEL